MQSGSLDVRASRPKPGDILAGKYRLEGIIGEGGMGTVYAARNLGTGKRVALKWVLAERADDEEILTRFQREARAAGRIDHPNVVSVFDVGQHGPSTFLVMELLNGQPLSALLDGGPLPPDAAVAIIMPALRGIAAAHALGVIHRDLKPDNIFLCMAPDGSPRETKVLDFGVSKMTDEVRGGLSVTKTGAVVGTPYYMSPEQVRGVKDIDQRIDVYAVGVILYEMLARRPPFVADSYSALVVEIATGNAPALRSLRPDLDPKLVQVIDKAMARDRDQRYQDIESLARALEPFADGVEFKPRRPDWTARISTKSGESAAFPSDAGYTDPDVELRQSGVETIAATNLPADESFEEAATATALPITLDTGDDNAVTTPSEGPPAQGLEDGPDDDDENTIDTLEDEPVPAVSTSRRKLGLWIGAGLVVVLLVVALAVAFGGGDGAVPEVSSEPADAVQATEHETAPADQPRTDPAAQDPSEPPAETGAADRPEQQGVEQAAPADDEPPAASEPSEAERAAIRRRAAARQRRRALRRAARAEPAAQPAMEPQPMSTMRAPRAGSLSLDDF